MDRGAWRAAVHGFAKDSQMTESLSVSENERGRGVAFASFLECLQFLITL